MSVEMKSDGFDDVPKNPFGVGHHVAVCYIPPHKSRRAGRGSEGVRPTKSQLAVYNVKIKKKANKREREEFFFFFSNYISWSAHGGIPSELRSFGC